METKEIFEILHLIEVLLITIIMYWLGYVVGRYCNKKNEKNNRIEIIIKK